jgi:ATP-dependent DNA helicase UvrD/PcrA
MAKAAPNTVRRRLNPKQELAVSHLHGPMLVRAGAGTGKTTVLVERISRLIVEKHATPEQILAVTYTEEAAREMAERAKKQIEAKLGRGSAEGLRTSTFHAACQGILKRNHAEFEVLDKQNLWVYLRRQLDQRRLPLKKFLKAANPAEFLNDFLDFFDRCSDELVDAKSYGQYIAELRKDSSRPLPRVSPQKEADQLSREEVLERCAEIAEVYTAVERLLEEKELGSFGLMIVRAVQVLRQRPEVLKSEQERTRFMLIDEFQDCNAAQIEFAQLLCGAAGNVFAVGDPDQAIYRFRGASSGAFDEFLARFPGAKTVALAENYRSKPSILKAAFALISSNPDVQTGNAKAEPRKLLESANGNGQPELFSTTPVEVVLNDGTSQEASDIAEAIQTLRRDRGTKWQEIAVLYRAHNHRLDIINELGARGIPFIVVGVDLLNTGVLRDIVAIFRSLLPVPDDISLFRMALMPIFGIDVNELHRELSAAKRNSTLLSVLQAMPQAKDLLATLTEMRASFAMERANVSALLRGVIKRFHMDGEREEVRLFADFLARWERLSITETKRLPELVEYLDYFCEAGGTLKSEKFEDVDAVRLMTVHAAKGLEFDHVFVLRIVSGSLPANFRAPLFEFPAELRTGSNISGLGDSKELNQEEERRILYVAMTRARQTLALHGKRATRGKDPVPSIFLREISKHKQAKLIFTLRDAAHVRFDMAASSQPDTVWAEAGAKKDWSKQPLSAYAVELYQTCPLKFKLARDWNLPTEPAAMVQYGSVMHRVLADYYNSVIAGTPYSEQQVLDMFCERLKSGGMEDPLRRELYLKQGASQLQELLRGTASAPPKVLRTEEAFSVEIAGTPVIGRIDRIDEVGRSGGEATAVELVDYKTGRPWSQKDAERCLQLAIYAIAAKHQWNYAVKRMTLHNLQNNSRMEVVPTETMLANAEGKIRETAESLREGNFAAKPGYHCRYCGYRELCPATEEKLYTIASAAATQ